MKKLLFVALLAFCLGLTACEKKSTTTLTNNQSASDQPVYDRINQTGTIRCGYAVWPPALMVDPNTKQITGIFHDVIEEAGKRLNLKIDWTEEVGWSAVIESVKNQRIDMACSDFWANSNRARQVDFTTPVYYSIANIWMRADDARTFDKLSDFNNATITFGTIEGSAEGRALHAAFPQAKQFTLPELNTAADELEGLKDKKYDAVAIDNASMAAYLQKNPGLFKKILPEQPLTLFPDIMLIRAGETKLKAMLDNTFHEIQYDGSLTTILEKYNAQGNVKLPAKPYQE